MKRISIRIIALTISICMMLSLAACTGEKDGTKEGGEKTAEMKDSIIITDMAGREVAIPKDTKTSTVATTYGVITPFFVTLKMSDRVDATTIKNKGFMRKVDSVIIETGDIGNLEIDAEALATYNPSILMCRTSESEKIAVGERLNIPTVAVYIESAEEVMEAYELLGKMFGVEERAKAIIDYINSELDEIDKLAATIPEEKKVTALCMGSELGMIAGENMLQTMMIERVGGKTDVTEVAEDNMWVTVGVESVFEKNPDFLFISSSNPLDYSIDELYETDSWSGMKAVQNKNVYQIPAKMDSWDMPGPGFVLAMYYMMHCMYPDLVDGNMLQEKIDTYYSFLYGKTFTGEEIGYSF